MKLIIIAWRNLWRNKKRTFLTISSVVFAIFFAVLMRSQQLGMYENAIENVIKLETGHIQLQGKGFEDSKSIDDGFEYNEAFFDMLKKTDHVEKTISRVNGFGMASTGQNSKEAMVMGMEVTKDGEIFSRNITAGSMIDDSSSGVVIGETLAHYLKIITYSVEVEAEMEGGEKIVFTTTEDSVKGMKVGEEFMEGAVITKLEKTPVIVKDTLVLLGQGYHGASAEGLYKVVGVMKLPVPDMNKRLVLMNIKTCQEFLESGNVLSTVNIYLDDMKNLDKVYNELHSKIDGDKYDLYKWSHLKETLVQQIESDNKSGLIFMAILYLIIGFGILGTIIMMTNERKKEFAVMIALGMKKGKLNISMIAEDFFIALLGSIGGILLSIPAVAYFYNFPIEMADEMAKTMEDMGWEPVMPFSPDPSIFTSQTMVVLILFAIASIYPLVKIKRLNVIKSIRG